MQPRRRPIGYKVKLSDGPGAVWMTLASFWYFYVLVLIFMKRGFPINGQWGLTLFFLLCFGFIGMIFVSGGPYMLIKNPSLLNWSSAGKALMFNAVIFAFYGAFVVVFGATPTRYYQRDVPRSASLVYFAISLGFASAGFFCLLVHSKRIA